MKPRSRPWRPKNWRTPKTPWRFEPIHSTEILKECYPAHSISGGPIMERSWAVKMARDRHWISWEEYFTYPLEDTGRVAKPFLGIYDQNPFMKLLRKDVDFAS